MHIDPSAHLQTPAGQASIGSDAEFGPPAGFTAAMGAPRASLARLLPPLPRPTTLPQGMRDGQPRAGQEVRRQASFNETGHPQCGLTSYATAWASDASLSPARTPHADLSQTSSTYRESPRSGSESPYAQAAQWTQDYSRLIASRPEIGPRALTTAALLVYESVRSHYRGHAKSGNKLRTAFSAADQRALADYARWQRAADLLYRLHTEGAPIQQTIHARVGNCDDMASHAALLAREAGLRATLWGMWDAQGNAGYHCFCVVSAPGEDAASLHAEAHGGGISLVIDPWAGIIDRVQNYGVRMDAKMHKWAREGKQIFCANLGGWIDATDHRWLDVVSVPRPFPIDF